MLVDDVIIWIIKNQFGRRNLSAYDRSILALKLKPVIAAKAKEKQLSTLKQNQNEFTVPQMFAEREQTVEIVAPQTTMDWEPPQEKKKSETDRETNAQIAQAAGVSRETIRKVERIEKQATPEVKAALKSGGNF